MTALYGPPLDGAFRWPAGFGAQRTPTHRHQGLDFNVPAGRKWLAVAAGEIEHALDAPGEGFAGYGRVVVLKFTDADGEVLRALYAHGKSVNVSVGQRVEKGDVLGFVGRSQFRTAQQLARQGVTPPEGYTRAMDEDGRVPRANGRSMGAHLHFELARHAYPMSSEAPGRIDPRAWFIARGIARPTAGARRPAPAAPAAPAPASRGGDLVAQLSPGEAQRPPGGTPHDGRQPAPDTSALRRDLMARVQRTDGEISRAVLMLNAASLTTLASTIQATWLAGRLVIVARINEAPATVDQLRQAVDAWIVRVGTMRDELLANIPAALAAVSPAGLIRDFAARLVAIWEGVRWVAGAALAAGAIGAGGALLVMFLIMAAGQYTGAKYVYRRVRSRYRSGR